MKKLSAGMIKDTALVDQPEGSMRDALNANLNIEKGTVMNEYGTYEFPTNDNFKVLGKVVTDEDELIMFGQYTIFSAEGYIESYESQIRYMNTRSKDTVILYNNVELNFRQSHPIVCTYRRNQANEIIVYFTDGFKEYEELYPNFEYISKHNPPRVINVTKQLNFRYNGGASTQLYNSINSHYKLNLVPRIGDHTTIDSVRILSGGSIKTGAYYLALAYADNEGLETNYFVVSNPAYITQRPENTIPTDAFIGSEGGIETAKSIQWDVTIPSTVEYDLLQPAIIKKEKGSISISKIPPVTIPDGGGNTRVTFTGTERSTVLNEQDVIIDDVEYITADTLGQLDNRLYLGNVTTNKDIGFQPFAHNIELEAVQDEVNSFTPRYYDTVILNQGYTKMLQTYDSKIGKQYASKWERRPWPTSPANAGGYGHPLTAPNFNQYVTDGYYEVLRDVMIDASPGSGNETLKGYRSPKYSFKKKGYRRNEVYAFYISFVLKDGTETYAYHIPGKVPSFIAGGGTDPGVYENTLLNDSDLGKYKIHSATKFMGFELGEQHTDARLHQVLDTNARTSDGMGFWENSNEYYPDTKDFLKGFVSSTGDGQFDFSNTIAGENVRHHKFPGNTTTQDGNSFGFVRDSDNTTKPYFDNSVGNANVFMGKNEGGYDGGVFGSPLNTNYRGGDNGAFSVQETIRILGFKIKNLRIPKSILSKVQGYKIYYAKRTRANKTILGQSVAVPGHVRYASVPEQNIAAAMKGPYKKAFYMYGGLDHTDNSSIDTIGRWRTDNLYDQGSTGRDIAKQRYYSHPVFKFHDFGLLRNRENLSSATHVSLQYGMIFRQFQGGPGIFVQPCNYDNIRHAPSADADDAADSPYVTENQIAHKDMYSTSFPSLGWVSAVMKNNIDFYFHNRYKMLNIEPVDKKLVGGARILDISDVQDSEFESDPSDEVKPAKRARLIRRGEDLEQPVEGDDSEQILAREAKAARVRAWFTSVMVAGTYVKPDAVVKNQSIIKAGDYKIPQQGGVPLKWSNRWWQNNGTLGPLSFTLAIEPGGLIFLPGLTEYQVKDNAAFKGAAYLYNNAGESAIAVSLVSGLPALRGHLPRWQMTGTATSLWGDSNTAGFLTRWGESNNYLYPDAAQDRVPVAYQRMGSNVNGDSFLNGTFVNGLYDPSEYRGLRYSLEVSNQYYGYPMAWLVNLCSIRTDVFNPFDRQELVWTGYFKKIDVSDIDTGETTDGNNYYTGAESDEIFGGDTYISKYSIRVTSQSYGHCFFRADRLDSRGGYIADSEENYYTPQPPGAEQAEHYYNIVGVGNEGSFDRFQGDLPAILNYLAYNEENTGGFGTTANEPIWAVDLGAAQTSEFGYPYSFAGTDLSRDGLRSIIDNPDNWVKGNVNPVSTLMTFMCESDDLIEFRHAEDIEKGVTTKFFDHNTANATLFAPPTEDYTNPDNLLYNDDYSSVQDIKTTQPLPVYGELAKVQTFPRRVVRSNVDSGSLSDGYRKFRALEYKDINSDKGEIKNLFAYRGNLYIHTDRSVFFTAGKEELQIGPSTAYLGSGDIFSRDPNEVQESDTGYGGTTSRHCHVTTPYGHFYLNYRDRRFYNLSGEGITDITQGMESWLRENMQFAVERFEIDIDSPKANANGFFTDATAGDNVPLGFTMGYDPMFRRILITKHEPIPTDNFMRLYNAGAIVIADNIAYRISTDDNSCTEIVVDEGDGNLNTGIDDTNNENDLGGGRIPTKLAGEVYCGPIWFGNPFYFKQSGWTVSYYPEAKIWGSMHSYMPEMYANTSEYLISFANRKTWEHTNKLNPGRYYGETYPFEVEYIDNTGKTESKLYSSIYYWADSKMYKDSRLSETVTVTNPVFTSFYVYNTTQISGTGETINYLSNARLVDRTWFINSFRDMSKQVYEVSDTIYAPDDAEGNNPIEVSRLITNKENVAGYVTQAVALHPQNNPMFKSDGSVNPDYIDVDKQWHNQRKFVDHFLGVRLKYDNSDRNLVHLYGVGTKFRKSYR